LIGVRPTAQNQQKDEAEIFRDVGAALPGFPADGGEEAETNERH
jgi:hypothetical protein